MAKLEFQSGYIADAIIEIKKKNLMKNLLLWKK